MKHTRKLAAPQILIVVFLGLISFIVIYASFDNMRKRHVTEVVEDHMLSLTKAVENYSERAIAEASLFAELPDVFKAYDFALSGDIDNPYSPQSQHARKLLRKSLAPILTARNKITGEPLQLHFHLPNGRSLVRLWRENNASLNGVDVDISDYIGDFRPTVMDALKTGEPVMGIESGIGGFAIRGVVPVKSQDGRIIGSLEVLQSFDRLSESVTGDFAIYANADILEFAADLRNSEKNPVVGNFVRIVKPEGNTIGDRATPELLEKAKEEVVYSDLGSATIAAYPLFDYHGKQAGVIVIGLDTTRFADLASLASVTLAVMILGMIVAPAIMLTLRIRHIKALQSVTETENLARIKADAANESKSVFLAQMSHEMRTPLNAILGLSELILENGSLTAEAEANLDKIYGAGSTLLSIVNDILDLSKIEAGKFTLSPREYDVADMINDAIAQNVIMISNRPIDFKLNIGSDAPARLFGDDLRVKQLINNLLSNAFKYTESGYVELSIYFLWECDSIKTTISVRDTGIGIKPEDIRRVYSEYTQFEQTANRKTNGTGLGLSITKRLAEQMEGGMRFESEYGKGSSFSLQITQGRVNDALLDEKTVAHLKNFTYVTDKRRNCSKLVRARCPGVRVLVVDDTLINLEIAKGLMKPYGMTLDCVTSGHAAIDAIKNEEVKYSAVFMDHMMPEMDGIEATRIIREEIEGEYAKTVPIIALTANTVAGIEEMFLGKGFDAFISKPIDIRLLDDIIRRWIKPLDCADVGADADAEAVAGDADADVAAAGAVTRSGKGADASGNADADAEADANAEADAGASAEKSSASTPAAAKSSAPAVHGFMGSERCDGLDWTAGLRLFGSLDAYRSVLRSFAVNTATSLDEIERVDKASLSRYAITVHGIKSSSRGVCIKNVGDVAEELEYAAKAGDLNFVRERNPAFIAELRALIAGVESALIESKPMRARPSDEELTRLCEACARYDLEVIDDAMGEIDKYEYTSDGGLVSCLRESVARLDYQKIIDEIKTARSAT